MNKLFDIFGYIFMILIFTSVVLISFYMYVYLSHTLEKDYKGNWFGRIFIVAGMSSIYLIIMLLEFDYLSHYKQKNMEYGFTFKLNTVWVPTIYFCAVLSIVQFFFIQYYRNAKQVSISKKILWASFVTFWPIVIYSVIAFNYSLTQSFSHLKLNFQVIDINDFLLSENNIAIRSTPRIVQPFINFKINWSLMLISPFLLFCSFVFSIFGGAGLAYFPVNLIKAYIYRPKEVSPEDIVFEKNALKEDSKRLLEKAKEVFNVKRDLILNQDMDKSELKMKKHIISNTSSNLIIDVISFEDAYNSFTSSQNYSNTNAIYYLGCLIVGVFGLLISVLLFVDTILSLNKNYMIMDHIFLFIKRISPVYSLIFFLFLCIYTSVAVTRGSYKLSKMIFFLYQALPIKANRTWTDAFLLNNIIVMMSTIGFFYKLHRMCPIFFSYLSYDIMMKNVMRNSFIVFFYKYKIFRFIYIFSYLIAIFTSLIFSSSKDDLNMRSEAFKKEHYKKKMDFQCFNKEILNVILK